MIWWENFLLWTYQHFAFTLISTITTVIITSLINILLNRSGKMLVLFFFFLLFFFVIVCLKVYFSRRRFKSALVFPVLLTIYLHTHTQTHFHNLYINTHATHFEIPTMDYYEHVCVNVFVCVWIPFSMSNRI